MTNAKMLVILVDETDMRGDVPLYEAIVRRLVQLDAAGATVQAGIMGFGSHGKVHRKRLFGVSDDRPISVTVIDSAEKIEAIVPDIRAMVTEGLMFVTDVETI